ncbi:EmrB/QacA subfamily drug resistance transporter [Allocatelliglobosispora scoriae]|uniref:EmrB/QacA subfamily drug resistance transporter n=1 Tax=Allocatelliglobosispora scoriae TaxID=643052 RepID=A0A841BMS0_9ACTN|nr:MFS transporter [Allocatelliglobosispora scoriae]MBB5868120.1 EmrB/QacA subfamily drug resistance transporter [Allocatelliglobosispora scoriae]
MTDLATRRAATATLIATCVSALVVNANTSAVSILLPAISTDTGTPVTTLQWAVTGYSLVGAATIVTAGALGDVFGRRKIFIGGLVLFVASCALIALSQGGGGVIAGRCIQGAAGSTILACGMSLISAANTGQAQMRAVTLWGAASAIGAAAGPLIGGLLVATTGWQGLFWIDAVIAAVCVPVTIAAVRESSDPNRPRSIDVAGTVLIAAILAPIIFALTEGSAWGWLSPRTIGCFLVSIAAAIGFVIVEKRISAPLLDLRLLRNRTLVGATLAILIGSGTLNAIMYIVSLYFQNPAALGMSALETGFATLPVAAAAVILAPMITPIVGEIGARSTVVAGFAIMTVAFVVLTFVADDWGYSRFVLPLVALAVGMSLQNGPASSLSTASVAPEEVGAASGISNMARYVGAAVMTAIVASIYASVSTSHQAAGDTASVALAAAVSRTALAMAIWCAVGVAMAALIGRFRPAKPRAVDYAAAAASTTHTLQTRVTPVGQS